jgi:glycogen operon protein
MLYAGDESERTQQGHANAYDQDNERSWLEWELTLEKPALLDFTRAVIALVQHHPVLRRRHFWHGQRRPGSVRKALAWFRPDGLEVAAVGGPSVSVGPSGRELRSYDDTRGQEAVLLNAQPQAVSFVLPLQESGVWEVLVWTDDSLVPPPSPLSENQECTIPAQSLALLRYTRRGGSRSDGRAMDKPGQQKCGNNRLCWIGVTS